MLFIYLLIHCIAHIINNKTIINMEFRQMRRKRQLLPQEDSINILKQHTSGTLAVLGDGGYPYAVPISYVYSDGKLFFHSAVAGHKIDAINACDKASFCVIDQDNIMADQFTTFYRSVIAFGRVRIIDDDNEKLAALKILGSKYSPHREEGLNKEIGKEMPHLLMLEMTIEHLTARNR
jgi:nitroimidazol reductase NimA-like FMN-containing flavoprotein (pyridoxamine 5'-phosphate oxidase superfamily)